MPPRASRPHPHLKSEPSAADPAPVRDPPQSAPTAPLAPLRCSAETATPTGPSRAVPRKKTDSCRWHDQRISPGRMAWTRFSAPTGSRRRFALPAQDEKGDVVSGVPASDQGLHDQDADALGRPRRHGLTQQGDAVIYRLVPAFHQPVGEQAHHGTGRESQRGDLPDWGIGDADWRIDGDLGQGTALAGGRDNRREMARR